MIDEKPRKENRRRGLFPVFRKPDEILRSLRSLTGGSSYSKLRSAAKARPELTFIGQKKVDEVKLQLFIYNEQECVEKSELDDFYKVNTEDTSHTYWLNLHGIHDTDLIERIGNCLCFERITTRQVVDTTQRPKVDDYDHYVYFSIKSVLRSPQHAFSIEQLSFVLGKNYVVSFQEERGDHFDHIRHKIREDIGVVRKRGCDFLLFQLLDAILDNYFETLEYINHEVAKIEREIISNPRQETLVLIEDSKREVGRIKKSLSPFKDALTNILKDRTQFITKRNRKYFRDLKNSCANAVEEAAATYASLESLTNIYFSSLSQKMNETIKVLTTVATIFIPLTFIVGIYGMNFDNMPELHWKYGYLGSWGVMIGVLLIMVIYFKRKKWI